jgi:hypothetical protein
MNVSSDELEQFYREADEREAIRKQPNISDAEFMATIKYTGDVNRMTAAEYNRYMRITTGDMCYGRRGYG